jgi:hypothetical protein
MTGVGVRPMRPILVTSLDFTLKPFLLGLDHE